jgi:cyclase
VAKWQFTKGLHDLGNGCYAGKETLLVDTLFDLKLTREMLDGMRKAVPQADKIGTLFNTHGNGDHTFGNQLVKGARILATKGTLADMDHRPPEQLYQMMTVNWQALGEAGRFMYEMMGSRFDFSDVVHTPPTDLFEGELKLTVGSKEVRLVELGPAHTRGDALAYVPADRTVFTGDLLFVGGHPILWAGPMQNWIKACDKILSWDVETVVPGHGPITDKSGVRAMKEYLEFTYAEARKRYDAGMTFEQAAHDINWDAFRGWSDSERLLVNIETCFREFANDTSERNIVNLFTLMARWRKAHPVAEHDHHHHDGCDHPSHKH